MAALTGLRGQVYTDRLFDASGTITTGGTAQLILPASRIRTSLIIQNLSTAAMYFEFGAGRAAATLTSGAVSSIAVTNAGFGYSIAPVIDILGGALGPQGNPQIAPAYLLPGLPEFTSPNKSAKAHCVMTGSAPNMSISSIVIDNPGSGYAFPPYILIHNHHNDPFGAALPSATSGIELASGSAPLILNGSVCPTDQISVFCATSSSGFACKYSI